MVRFPKGLCLERLDKTHKRKLFYCGQELVDEWLKSKARQSQEKNLSRTKVLINHDKDIIGFYTLSIYQINFDELPYEVNRKLPKTLLPAMKLAWLGVHKNYQGKGLAKSLLASALLDCYTIGQSAPFCAVLLDCIDEDIKSFYLKYDFLEVPGHKLKLALSWKTLELMCS